MGLGEGEGEGEGLGDGDGLGEGDGDGEWVGLGEGFGVGRGLDLLAPGDEPVGEEVDGVPVGGVGSAAISRPNVGGKITLGAEDEPVADEGRSARVSENGHGPGAWVAANGANEGGESANSSFPLVAWE